jgi:glycosyltransferase involved in cell wall biosynthesis
MVLIRHGITLPDEALLAANRRYATPARDKPLQIGYIGSIAWQKGVHILIEAFNDLPPGSVQLTIYGDLAAFPDYAAQLKEMIQQPGITLAGPLSREKLWPALAELDLVILPTLWYETSSLVLDEAFAATVPVVASNIGVMSEKVDDGRNGRLFPAGDTVALRQILTDIGENPALLDRWRTGIPPVRTIAEHVKEIEELYHSTLDTV